MKSGILTKLAAVAAFALAPVSANALSGEFRGGGTIYDYSWACINNGGWTDVPHRYTVRYQPRNVGGNRNRDLLSFLSEYHAFSFLRNENSFQSWWTSTRHGFLGSGIGYWNEGDDWSSNGTGTADIIIDSMYPANLTENTAGPVRIRGRIRHLGGVQWCSASFDVIVQQR